MQQFGTNPIVYGNGKDTNWHQIMLQQFQTCFIKHVARSTKHFAQLSTFRSKHQTNCATIRPTIHLDAQLAEKFGKNTDLIKILGG